MEKSHSIVWCKKIKKKLIISINLIFIISFIFFSFICAFCFKTQIIQEITQKNIQLSANIKKKSELFLSSIINDLFSLADHLAEKENWEYQQANLFDRYLKKMPNVGRLTLFDNTGKKRLTVFKNPPELINNDWAYEGPPHGDKISILKKLFISPVYPSSHILPMIDISIPIRNYSNNKINGVIKAALSFQGLWGEILDVRLGDKKTAYVIDKNGNLITHSKLEPHFAAIDFSHIKMVKQFFVGTHEKGLKSPEIYYNHKNTKVIGTLSLIEKTDWGIIIEEPVALALSPYYHLQKALLFVLAGVILIVCLIIFFFISYVTRSIDKNSRQAGVGGSLIKNTYEKIGLNQQDEMNHKAKIDNHLPKQSNKKDKHLKFYDDNKQVREKLEKSQPQLDEKRKIEKQFIETADVLILVLNQEGEIILFNKKCEQLIGYKKVDAIGSNWLQLMIPHENREKCLEHFKRAFPQKTVFSFECPIVTKEGIYRTIFWRSTFIVDEKQNIMSINIGEDITEKKSFQQELERKIKNVEEKNEELQNFVSIVSHDLKSPLHILQDFTYILLNDHKAEFGDDVTYYLERIKKNAENMEKLIIDILEFSKIGTIEEDFLVYPIVQIVQRAVEELNPKIKEKNIHLIYPGNFPPVFCSPNRMLQVFMNLISNSLKFMCPERAGLIEIGYFEREKLLKVMVGKFGLIHKKERDQLFSSPCPSQKI